jgi:hypothetical protein
MSLAGLLGQFAIDFLPAFITTTRHSSVDLRLMLYLITGNDVDGGRGV